MIAPLVLIVATLIVAIAFVIFKSWESRRGTRLFEATRALWDTRAQELWSALVMGGIPLSWRRFAQAVAHEIGHEAVLRTVSLLRAVERPLSRLSYRMRISAPKTGGAPVSEFLKTITPDRSSGDFQEKSV